MAAETLTIRIGSTNDTLAVCCPNDDERPFKVKNDNFEGDVLIRVKDFRGVVPENTARIASSSYFDGRKRLMSFQFQGKFAKEWSGDDLVWSQDWDQPLSAPKMIGLFTKFWSMTDPGSFSEINIPTPFMRSYILTAMCAITSWPANSSNEPFRPILAENVNGILPADALSKRKDLSAQFSGLAIAGAPGTTTGTPVVDDEETPESVLTPEEIAAASADTPTTPSTPTEPKKSTFLSSLRKAAASASGSAPTPAQIEAARQKEIKLIEKMMLGGDDSVKERRKYFGIEENRKEVVFKPDTVYAFEVFNPYFDPNEFKIKIPGITIDLNKVTNGQPMRLRLMSKDGSTVFFVVDVSVTQPEEVPGSVADDKSTTLGKLWGRFSKQ